MCSAGIPARCGYCRMAPSLKFPLKSCRPEMFLSSIPVKLSRRTGLFWRVPELLTSAGGPQDSIPLRRKDLFVCQGGVRDINPLSYPRKRRLATAGKMKRLPEGLPSRIDLPGRFCIKVVMRHFFALDIISVEVVHILRQAKVGCMK